MHADDSLEPISCHTPVLLKELLEALDPQPGQIMVDGTLGGGGHALAIAERLLPGGYVIGLDRDLRAVEIFKARYPDRPVRAVHASYADLPEVLAGLGVPAVSGLVLDLGISSDQLADTDRGFSFRSDGELDMRFDRSAGEPAWRLLSRLSEKHLADMIFAYGEERFSRRIARAIVARRHTQPIRRASELAQLIESCVPHARHQRIHPATRTFQALRIAVNDELKWLEVALRRLPQCMHPGGRVAVMSYHSLEDRRVKLAFRQSSTFDMITRKPIRASDREVYDNPRSRSAVMRVAAIRDLNSSRT